MTGGFDQYYGDLVEEIRRRIAEKIGCEEAELPTFSVKLRETLISRLQRISIRTLILEMKVCDRLGMLGKGNEVERYQVFANHFLLDGHYLQELYSDYKVMYKCLVQYVECTAESIAVLLQRFEMDKDEINHRFFLNNPMDKITVLEDGSSDSHRGGQCVYILRLNNGENFVYKPRNMELDEKYIQFTQRLFYMNGVKFWWNRTWNRGEYGWSEWVEEVSCRTKELIERYYHRVGMLLCVGYLLGTSDIHYENLIACGEFPVIVDLETAIGKYEKNAVEESSSIAEHIYQNSVLHTGILPMYTYNEKGEGINVGAIDGQGGQLVPIKSPMIVAPGTTNMHVEYRNPKMKEGKNLVRLNENFVLPYDYLQQIQCGFREMYLCVEGNREQITEWLEEFKGVSVRRIVCNTQMYAMFLMSSYHPELLMDNDKWERFFQNWNNGKNVENTDEGELIKKKEIQAMKQGDIPYFSYSGEDCLSEIRKRLERMHSADLCRQQKLIANALYMGTKIVMSGSGKTDQKREIQDVSEDARLDLAERIGRIMLENALWSEDKTDIGWINIVLVGFKDRGYLIRPASDYLYDGTAGIALFLSRLSASTRRTEFTEMMETVKRKLFAHTDRFVDEGGKCGRLTGAYNGEASVAYAYQKLYTETNDETYLYYMNKQCGGLARILEYDQNYDLLGGNAGAILVLLNAYDLTENSNYIEYAKRAANLLIHSAIQYDYGWGWVTKHSEKALTGMAHGASGIMLAFSRLWKYTREEIYLQAAEKAYQFEQHYFHPEWKDWEDRRYPNGNTTQQKVHIAWCHGRGGIELAREGAKQNGMDIPEQNKYRLKMSVAETGKYCLCHGGIGAATILYGMGDVSGAQLAMKHILWKLHRSGEDISNALTLQECENFGLMGGIAGIGYACLSELSDIKKILLVES